MKIIDRKCKLELCPKRLSIRVTAVLFLILFNVSHTFAQDTILTVYTTSVPATTVRTRELFGGKITNSGYGGVILKFSRFNDQFAFMTGGRGAITINNRYTIGGGGYGIATGAIIIQRSRS